MIRRDSSNKKKGFEEQLVQKFSYYCPYCNRPISYDRFDLKVGENEIRCPSCKKIYIKVITPPFTRGGNRSRRR